MAGSKAARLRDRARRLSGGLWRRQAKPGNHFFYRVRKGKVAYAGVVSGALGRKALRTRLARAALK